jgi:hypothetical protein
VWALGPALELSGQCPLALIVPWAAAQHTQSRAKSYWHVTRGRFRDSCASLTEKGGQSADEEQTKSFHTITTYQHTTTTIPTLPNDTHYHHNAPPNSPITQ